MPIRKEQLIPKATKVQIATSVHDMVAAVFAFAGAFFLRLSEDAFPIFASSAFWMQCALFVVLAALISRVMGLNRGLWRYASMPDMVAIVKTGVLTTVFFAVTMFMIDRLNSIPRTAVLISCVLLITFLSASRIGYRWLRNRRDQRLGRREGLESVLLVGSGDGADLFIRAANERRDMHYDVCGVYDESGRRAGLKMRDVTIIAGDKALMDLVRRNVEAGTPIRSFVLTKRMGDLPGELVDRLIDLSAEYGIGLKQIPRFDAPDEVTGQRIEPRPVRIEDLLARPEVALDDKGLGALIQDSTIVVTGAGGSIGSQLCRELLTFTPKHLILLDLCEFNLYSIDTEIRGLLSDRQTKVTSLLCDVRQRKRLMNLFREVNPDLVFHAAALKHVPIVQSQPVEGLHTNILGSRNVFDAAKACAAKAMVLVSTDKAVNPTSVMGATKRAAELYCQINDMDSETRCVIVRFGNVLGSAGSVVPHFRRQIAEGGPITVTHKDITRYFMTIPEACQLVLQAAHMGLDSDKSRGWVHVLDMGEPVKIENLAKKMITLSGLRPGVDIEIVYTGLRPGEKLHEELFGQHEQLVGSSLKSIFIATPPVVSQGKIAQFLANVEAAVDVGDAARAVSLLADLLPEARFTTTLQDTPMQNVASDNVVEFADKRNPPH